MRALRKPYAVWMRATTGSIHLMDAVKFPFVDASFAAELLGVQTADVLSWIAEGKLQTFGGKERNPFVRTTQLEALAREMGKELGEPAKKRRAADNPVRRVELRIRHDAKWSEITDTDLQAWLREQDPSSLAAAKRVVDTTTERLDRMRRLLGDQEV